MTFRVAMASTINNEDDDEEELIDKMQGTLNKKLS